MRSEGETGLRLIWHFTCRRKVTFIDKDGDEQTFEVADGDNLLDIAQANDIEMEGTLNPAGSVVWPLSKRSN